LKHSVVAVDFVVVFVVAVWCKFTCGYAADAAYMDNHSYDILQLTAWIPMMNATKENGCMQVSD